MNRNWWQTEIVLAAICAFVAVRHASASFDDANLIGLSKCAKTALDEDIKNKATKLCDEKSKSTYDSFVTCATEALKETVMKSVKIKGHQFDVKDAAKKVKDKFCGIFPFLNKFPATFYRTIQASLIIHHENLKRTAFLNDDTVLDFVFGDDRKEHVLWDGAIGDILNVATLLDHVRKGIAAEIYTHAVEADFWKHTYGLSTPTDAQMKDIEIAAAECTKVFMSGSADKKLEMQVCHQALGYRKNGLNKQQLIVGRSKLASYEACVRARYHFKQSTKTNDINREFLVMEPSWKNPAPKNGMLILQKDPKAPTASDSNPIDGEMIFVEAEFREMPPTGMEEVLAFTIEIACAYESNRIKRTQAVIEMCDWLDVIVPPVFDVKFSHLDYLDAREKDCDRLLNLAKKVAFEMLEQSPWITWTGKGNMDTDKDLEEEPEEVIVLQQAFSAVTCKRCFVRLFESCIKKLLCDSVFALIRAPIEAINILTPLTVRLPGTDNFILLMGRFLRCILTVAKIKTAAYTQQQKSLGKTTPFFDKFWESMTKLGLGKFTDKLPPEAEGLEDELNDATEIDKIEMPKVNVFESIALMINEGGEKLKNKAAGKHWLVVIAGFAEKHKGPVGFAADVLRFFPILDPLIGALFWLLQDMMSAYSETADDNWLKVREEDQLWKKTLKRVASTFQTGFANFYNKVCDFLWEKVRGTFSLAKDAAKAALRKMTVKDVLDEFMKQRAAEFKDMQKMMEDLKNAGNEYKKALNDAGWKKITEAIKNSGEKVKKLL